MISNKKPPANLPGFRDWLQEAFDSIQAAFMARPDAPDQLNVDATLQQAFRYACKFGAGDVAGPIPPLAQPATALVVLGRLLAWAADRCAASSELISVEEVAGMLGVSTRTVWRMTAADEIPQPVKIRGTTRWRRSEIQATIDLLEPAMR